jgi:hypothetical protein
MFTQKHYTALLAALAAVACKPRDFDNTESEAKGIEIVRTDARNVVPPLNGCFRVSLLKMQSIKSSTASTARYFDENCNFLGSSAASGSEVLKSWQAARNKQQTPGCFLAFEPPKVPIVFQYQLLVTQNVGGESAGSWNEVLREGNTNTVFSESLNQNVTVKLDSKSFQNQRVLVTQRGKDSGIVYVSPNGTTTAAGGSIVVDYKGSVPTVLKYDGHVVENVPCR